MLSYRAYSLPGRECRGEVSSEREFLLCCLLVKGGGGGGLDLPGGGGRLVDSCLTGGPRSGRGGKLLLLTGTDCVTLGRTGGGADDLGGTTVF